MAGAAFDHIVVGGGTAGCTVAGRLAERGARVLLLEAGAGDARPIVRIPAGAARLFGHPRHDWNHVSAPDPSLDGRSQPYSAGRLLGGGSSINGMLWVRGSGVDYDAWAAAGNPGWDHASLLPLFKRLEGTAIGDDAWRGRAGRLPVSPGAAEHALCAPLAEAFQRCGVPRTDDYNGARFEGVSTAQVTQRRGLRENAARAFGIGRGSTVQLAIGTLALRLLFDGPRCCGVEGWQRGQRIRWHCDGEVIVAAGALGTPKLLLLSGIGPADELRALGIAVRADVPGVGGGLMDHPTALVTVASNVPTYNSDRFGWRALLHGADFVLRRRGPIAAPHAQLLAHLRTTGDAAAPDAQIAFYPFSFERSDAGATLARGPSVLFTLAPCRSDSRGRVRLAAADPQAALRIEHRALDAPHDLATLVRAGRLLRRVLAAEPIRRHLGAPIAPGPDVDDDASWQAYLRATTVSAYHYAGTCRMGPDAAAVVDAALRVRGVAGLRVADASVMPALPSGNTQAAAYVIGEKAADLIRGAKPAAAAAAAGASGG